MDDFQGKRILVVGGSSGIGFGIAQTLLQRGAEIIISSRNETKLLAALEELLKSGPTVSKSQFDIEDIPQIDKWLTEVAQTFGPLDGVVHSAGAQQTLPVRFTKDADLERLFRLNVFSAFALARSFRRKGISNRPAGVVFIASVAGIIPQTGAAAYSASKAALQSFTRSIAGEFASEGIRVNCIAPGFVDTPLLDEVIRLRGEEYRSLLNSQHPLGLGNVNDVADSVAYLLSERSKWITGSTLLIDGGYLATK